MTAETSIAALNMALHCDAIAVTDALTAHYWMAQHGGTARIISDLPEYRVAIFEPVGTSASMIDREFQSAVIDQIERIRLWAETAA